MTIKRILELTLLYPVVTIALLGPVAIVFMPHRCARLNANETAAIATLRNLASAQEQFRGIRAVDLDRDGRGEYGTFRELSAGGFLRGDELLGRLHPPHLSGAFRTVGSAGEVNRSGYYFRIYLPGADGVPHCPDRPGAGYDRVNADLAEEHWFAHAWPMQITLKQRRMFFVNEDGVVFGTELETALGRTGPDDEDQPDQRTRIWHEVR